MDFLSFKRVCAFVRCEELAYPRFMRKLYRFSSSIQLRVRQELDAGEALQGLAEEGPRLL